MLKIDNDNVSSIVKLKVQNLHSYSCISLMMFWYLLRLKITNTQMSLHPRSLARAFDAVICKVVSQ